MSLCVTLDQNGRLTPTGQPVNQCTGYVLVSASEYGVFQTVNQALATPTPADAAAWFAAAFAAPLTIYMVAHYAGRVARMFG